jgi:spore coat protein U-like protein
MQRLILALGTLTMLLKISLANAAVTCSMSVTNVQPIYSPSANRNADATGNITLNCTRTASEASTPYWIGINTGSSVLTRQTGTQTLSYGIYSNSNYNKIWDNASGAVTGTLNFTSSVATTAVPYYFRIPRSNSGQPPGLYDMTALVTQRFSSTGADISTTSLSPVASILSECRISSSPSPLVLNYASFSAVPVASSSDFNVSCTNTTPYTMALDATSGTLLGLNYTVALNANNGTGTALPQTYSVIATIPENQSGSCATGVCSSSQTRTITITY